MTDEQRAILRVLFMVITPDTAEKIKDDLDEALFDERSRPAWDQLLAMRIVYHDAMN